MSSRSRASVPNLIHNTHHKTERKPVGQSTRGKTAPNRLRRVDNFVARYDPALIRRQDGDFAGALVVDLGFGAEAVTTVEMAQRLRRINPALRVVGVEIDAERVAAAQPFADSHTEFRLGGFNLPLRALENGQRESVRLVRAFNVLRQYEESAVLPAWARLAVDLPVGALIVEGTSDPLGRVWVANLLRKIAEDSTGDELARIGLAWEAHVFSTNFRTPFEPGVFQPVLPKHLIHRVEQGEPIHAFFADWKQAAQVASPMRAWGQRQWFEASAQELAQRGWRIDTRSRWLRSGYLILRTLVKAHKPNTEISEE